MHTSIARLDKPADVDSAQVIDQKGHGMFRRCLVYTGV